MLCSYCWFSLSSDFKMYAKRNNKNARYLLSQIWIQKFLFTSNQILYSQLTPPFDPHEVTAFDRNLKLTANRINRK
jgi:hypothetical protein